MTSDHAQTLRLGQKGAAPTPGIQLVTVFSLPEVAFRGQMVYCLDIDEFRVFDGDAWQIPTAASAGGTQTFVGPTEPVADSVGDLWMKNTTYQLYVWDGTVWREVQDPTAEAAQAAAATALANAQQALNTANDAQATADGKVETFYQGLQPALPDQDPQVGDLWFRTTDNRAFRFDGSNWVSIQDQSIVTAIQAAGTAQATADQKITTYYSGTPPWPDAAPGHGNDIGDLWFNTDDNNHAYRWDGHWTSIQDGGISTAQSLAVQAQATANQALDLTSSDGVPPSTSPTPTLFGGIRTVQGRFDAITNADPVIYDVYISSVTGFVPNSSSLAVSTTANAFTLLALPGQAPPGGQTDPRKFLYGVNYYVRVGSRDADGAAAVGPEVAVQLNPAGTDDITAGSVTTELLSAGAVDATILSGEIVMAGSLKTANAGQRVEIDSPKGIRLYAPDGSTLTSLPTTDGEEAFMKGKGEFSAASFTGSMTVSTPNALVDRDGAISLASGTATPIDAPQLAWDYDKIRFDTTILRTGSLGTFSLNPGEVHFIRYDAGIIRAYQIKSNGTRVWTFNPDGTPQGTFFTDVLDREIRGATTIGTTTYTVFRYIPSGANNDYYVSAGTLLNRYTRLNVNRWPSMGQDSTGPFVAEANTSNRLQLRRFTMNSTVGGPVTIGASVTFDANSLLSRSPNAVLSGNFDYGAARYVVAEEGANFNTRTADSSGNWQENEDWESAADNKRGLFWDGTNFWTYFSDGYLYKQEAYKWTTESPVWWGAYGWYQAANSYETKLGMKREFTMHKRAKLKVEVPAIPGAGGISDPDSYRFYLGRGSSAPADAAMFLQREDSVTPFVVSNPVFSGTTPPSSNNFPGVNPALLLTDALGVDSTPRFYVDGSGGGRWEGEDWITIGDVGAPAFVNSFTAVTGYEPQIRKDPLGNVHMRGVVNIPVGLQTTTASANIFILPTDWWPAVITGVVTLQDATPQSAICRTVVFSSSGAVAFYQKIGTATQVHIDGIFSTR